jgi:hypothetical protein
MTRFRERTSLLAIPLDLTFTELVHGFIALDGLLHRVDRSTSQPWIHTVVHESRVEGHC